MVYTRYIFTSVVALKKCIKINTALPKVVQTMNLDLGEPYSIHSFESTRGRDGGTLWSQFQSSYHNAFIAHSVCKPALQE